MFWVGHFLVVNVGFATSGLYACSCSILGEGEGITLIVNNGKNLFDEYQPSHKSSLVNFIFTL